MKAESEINIECKVFRTCNCIKRLIFIMGHYDEWCRKNEKKKICKGLSINDIIEGLPSYNIIQLWNDFIHAKQCHFIFYNNNNHENIIESIQVWEYIESKLGHRDINKCEKFIRNNRNRSISGTIEQRKSLYYGFTDSEEIISIQFCDTIWEFLFHSKILFKNEFANKILYDPNKIEKELMENDNDNDKPRAPPPDIQRRVSVSRRRSMSNIARKMQQRLEKQKQKEKEALPYNYNHIQDDKKNDKEEFKYSQEDKKAFESYIKLRNNVLCLLNDKEKGKNGDGDDNINHNVIKSKFVTKVYHHNTSNLQKSITFGVSFVYWDGYSSYSNYIKTTTYSNLKDEILNNPYYKLTLYQWSDCLIKSMKLNATNIGKEWVAKNAGILNKRYNINAGLPISTSHIMCVLFYINYKDLQYAFKTNGCRKLSGHETTNSVKFRNKNIGNWYRFFTECITLFGGITNEKEIFYHGLSKKINLIAFKPDFKCMISTTSSLSVAQSIISNDDNGIIIKLQQKRSLPHGFLDVNWMSDFQNEAEKIFSFSKLDVVDIYQNTPTFRSNTVFVKSLILFQSIIKGHYFQHTIHSSFRYQRVIIAMIQSWMKDNVDVEADDDHKDQESIVMFVFMFIFFSFFSFFLFSEWFVFKLFFNLKDIEIPEYMQRLFNSFVERQRKLFVIRSQYDHLYDGLKKYLIDFDDNGSYEFHSFLMALKNKNPLNKLKLKLMKEYRWCISGDSMNKFKQLPINNTIKGKYFHAGNDVVLYPRLRRSDRDFPDKSMMFCNVEDMPSDYNRIYIQWEIFCKETNYHSSQNRFLKNKESAGYTVSNTKDLCALNEFTFEISVQILNIEKSSF